MNDRDKKNIEWIIYYSNRIDEYLNRFGINKEIYMTDTLYQDACALLLIQIGEHVSRLSDNFKEKHSEIDWKSIKGMRNIHAHQYDRVISHIVWDSLTEEIPYLKEYLEKLL